jgi:hypothetical protein
MRDSAAKQQFETVVEERTASIARIQFEQGALADEAAVKRAETKRLRSRPSWSCLTTSPGSKAAVRSLCPTAPVPGPRISLARSAGFA